MAVNEHTLNQARRTLYFERRQFPRQAGQGESGFYDVLLPYSKLEVDGEIFYEMNHCTAQEQILDEDLKFVPPSHGVVVATEYREASKGVVGEDVSRSIGLTRPAPGQEVIHQFGWV